jgi:tRNA dimethylallyltransferase
MVPKFLIVIAGPTAVGKTPAAIELARRLGTEIVNADSRQVYREMKIGTAMPSDSQLAAVKHHLAGHLSIAQPYNASMYENEALRVLEQLFLKYDRVILTGGSGMYIDAVCNGIDDIPSVDPEVREKLRMDFHERGLEYIRMRLKEVDPEYYAKADLNNPKRILKALEVSETSGRPYSQYLTGKPKKRYFGVVKIGLDLPRAVLHDRINLRVLHMLEEGLEAEARSLFPYRQLNALNTLGYKELFDFFDGKTTLAEAVIQIQGHSRQYARRQITWFRKDTGLKWFDPAEPETMMKWIDMQTDSGKHD